MDIPGFTKVILSFIYILIMNTYAPVCLFVYNRLDYLVRTVTSLQNNALASYTDLHVFCDGVKEGGDHYLVDQVRGFISKGLTGFKSVTVHKSEKNNGLAASIVAGVSLILESNESVIVLEDDLVTSPNFLSFMNEALSFYKGSDLIQSVSGYSMDIGSLSLECDVHFQRRAHSWGWATWRDKWDKSLFFNETQAALLSDHLLLDLFKRQCGEDIVNMLFRSFNGEISSWYAWWALDHVARNRLAVYPFESKVEHIGFSLDSTNCKGIDVFKIKMDVGSEYHFDFCDPILIKSHVNAFLRYYSFGYKLKYRLLLLFRKGGIKALLFEIKTRFIK